MFKPNRFLTLTPLVTITAAVTGITTTPFVDLVGMDIVTAQFTFTYGSGGTTLAVYLQTTMDGGTTWFDVMNWSVTTASVARISSVRAATAVAANYTPTDGSLAANTIKDGLLGDQLRLKYTSTGTYAGGTTFLVTAVVKGRL